MSTPVCGVWATTADMCPPCIDSDIDPTLLDKGLVIASEVLYNLTGRAWPGATIDKIRPVGRDCWLWRGWRGLAVDGIYSGTMMPSSGWLPYGWTPDPSLGYQGQWLSEIRLPGFPVVSVDKVTLDGVVLPVDRYRVDNRRTLVALPHPSDAWRGWPVFQRDALAVDQPGTFGVEYKWGELPPPGGVNSAAIYGCELALGMSPKTIGACRLPKRVTTVTRAGMTMAIIDPMTIVKDGMVGLPEVDMWVASVWFGRRRRRASITAVDQRKPSRRNAATP